ncbi:MAG: hypothetical protein ACW98Y_07705 [Candidatus Thorarchaeota archaeon]|jgi:hypothetical protein
MTNTASSLLVLLKHDDQESVISAIGNGNILWSGHRGFDWIGEEAEEWDSVLLVQYSSPSIMQESVERFREKNFERIRIYSVHLQSKMRIRVVRFMMKYIFSRSSVEFHDEIRTLEDIPKSEILPTKEQMLRLMHEKKDGPIVMVNFLSFFDKARYLSGFKGERGVTGEQAYDKYGQHAMRAVAKLGGVLEHGGAVESLLLGDSNIEWNQFGLMRYHTLEALQGMFKLKENVRAGTHRDAGLKSTRVYAFTPDN